MAKKELRKMSRTELIEIIYILQQDEKTLKKENEDLRRQLDDKRLRLEKAGSIAEAALSLNHIFEDAQEASRQYLETLVSASAEAEDQAKQILEDAQKQAEEILAAAQEQRRQIQAECEQLKAEATRKLEDESSRCQSGNQDSTEELS